MLMNYFFKFIALILISAVSNFSWAEMLSCRLEGMSLDDGPVRQHPTGERVTINVMPSSVTLWSNQEYVRLSKQDKILPSGNNMHVYGKKSDLMDKGVDLVTFSYEKNGGAIFFQTINRMSPSSEMSVYGRCFKK